MAFLNKLRDAANKAKDAASKAVDVAGKAMDAVQNLNNPLADETTKVYYEIAYGALKSLGVGANYEAFKKYIAFHTGQPCDEAILQKVLIWFADEFGKRKYYLTSSEAGMRARANGTMKPKSITPSTTEKIIEINKELDRTPKYRCSFEEACDICYKEEVAQIRAEYLKVFDIIAEREKYRYLEAGLKKIEKTYQEEYCTLARRLLRKWIFEDLEAGKDIVQKAYAEAVIYSIKGIRENRECITGGPASYVAAVAIRALHFEQYGWSKENYSSITAEECNAFVKSHSKFMSLWDNAYNTDRVVGAIRAAKIPSERNHYAVDDSKFKAIGDFWTPQVGREDYFLGKEDYFVDMICYHAWKTLCEEFTELVNDDDEPVCQSKKPDDITALLFHGSVQHYGEPKIYSSAEPEPQNFEEAQPAKAESAPIEKQKAEKDYRTIQAEREQAKQEQLRRQQEENERREEARKNITYYCFGPMDYDGVNVISYVNNVYAAKKAMLKMYGKTEADIKFYSATERKDCSNYFDGRKCN